MNCKTFFAGVVALGLLVGCATEAENQAALAARAKVSRADAEKAALEKAPDGKIVEGELEEEGGKLIWSFDIARPGTKNITEVAVDAITGKVIGTEIETPAQQAKEKAEDAAKEKKKKN
ncbi:MAG: PepSY domain-containing protein [Verrucomicrobia bacterium]|nr:PepSY domain-containing protein [Verrucomicrobiota bacterium]